MRPNWLCLLMGGLMLLPAAHAALAQTPATVLGTWTGKVAQNKGSSGYSVVMTVAADSVVTDYPELKCSGKLTQVGSAEGYVFFTESITRGGKKSGGSCIDGTITVAPAGDRLVWGWVGAFSGETYVAWGTLKRK